MSVKRGDDKSLYYIAGFVILCLIGVQLYWISRNIYLQKNTVERQLKEDIDNAVKEVVENAYCFSFYSKAFLKDEGIYIIRQKYGSNKFLGPKEGGYIDTLDLYNVFYEGKDTSFYKDHTIFFSKMPATVDIALKFTFAGANPRIKRTDTGSYNLSNLTSQNFRDVLSNKFRIDEAIDVHQLDNLIKQALIKNHLDTLYKMGIRKGGASQFEYLKTGTKPGEILGSNIKTIFLQNRFDRPYELLVTVPDSFNSIIRAMAVMMISSAIIILILIISYAYFVRTILNQKKLSNMKNAFINNITHEFRTPITNIKLAVDNWNDAMKTENYYTKVIAEENERMERNVEQILQVATFEHGNMQTLFSAVDIQEIIHETVNSFYIRLTKIKGTVYYNMGVSPVYVYGDKVQLKNMFCNLVDNAIKYNKGGLIINISAKELQGYVHVEIEDNGMGMKIETVKHIFDTFYRGDTGDRHDVKGFGLGLSYVKQIIQMHKGEITVKSREGEGTIFTIKLPRYNKSRNE